MVKNALILKVAACFIRATKSHVVATERRSSWKWEEEMEGRGG